MKKLNFVFLLHISYGLLLEYLPAGASERKRGRAQPPEGWLGENRNVKKRQVTPKL